MYPLTDHESSLIPALDEGWEILQLASLNDDKEIQGVVRLNKQLAFLQLEGYPVPIQFECRQMGPASLQVRERARLAEKADYLRVEETRVEHRPLPRVDFKLTPNGQKYLDNVVVPTLSRHARGKMYTGIFLRVALANQYEHDKDLINEIHQILYLDDRDQFLEAYAKAATALEAWEQKSENWGLREDLDMVAGACVDLSNAALAAVEARVKDEKDISVGKHNILWNCERLLKLLDVRETQGGKDRNLDQSLTQQFDRVLNALEVNCDVYNVISLKSDAELDEILAEAPPYDHSLVT